MAASSTTTTPGSSHRSHKQSPIASPVTSKEQQLVINVFQYFQKEKENKGKPLLRKDAMLQKSSKATGVSRTSVKRVLTKQSSQR